MSRRATSHGAKTRATILQTAADLASVDGLDGLSIGRLATELAMSKSGLFAHFGSKEICSWPLSRRPGSGTHEK